MHTLEFWLFCMGLLLEVLGLLNSLRVLKKLKKKVDIIRPDDDTLDTEEKGLLKQNLIWVLLILLGAIVQFLAKVIPYFHIE